MKYVLVTPARNEQAFLQATIEGVLAQTVRPLRWVIVDDRSSDRTAEIVQAYLPQYEFIRLLRVTGEDTRHFGKKAAAFNAGLELLQDVDYEFIGNLDADIKLPPEYYENILEAFRGDPGLGLAGGTVCSRTGDRFVEDDGAPDSVPGAIQLFRKACFHAVGGKYQQLELGGIDAAAEILARMNGWKVRKIPLCKVWEGRQTGTASNGILRAKFKEGLRFHAIGYSSSFYLLRAVRKMTVPPVLVGSMVALAGFLWAKLTRAPISLQQDVVDYLREEQKTKLRQCIFRLQNPPVA